MRAKTWHWTIVAVVLPVTPAAQAAEMPLLSYTFRQDGYSEGAFVTGSFTGFDLDANDLLVRFSAGNGPPIANDELTSFSMTFSGNSLAPAFSLGLDDLFGFVFEIDSGDLGDDPAFDPILGEDLIEGIGAIGDAYFYTSGNGPNSFVGGFVGGEVDLGVPDELADAALDRSQQVVRVKLVPEPASLWLLTLGAAGLALRKANRRVGIAHRPLPPCGSLLQQQQ